MKFEDIKQKFLVEELQELCTKVIAKRDALAADLAYSRKANDTLNELYSDLASDYAGLKGERDALAAKLSSVRYTGELPELPESFVLFSKRNMQDYARQAIAGYLAKVGQSELVQVGPLEWVTKQKPAPQPAPAAVNQVMLEALKKHGTPPGDWACKECRPNSDMLKAGFLCSYHAAIAAAEAQQGETK